MNGVRIVAALILTGCTAGPGDDASTASDPPDVSCTVAYRSAVTEPLEPSREVTLMAGESDNVELGDVTIAFDYSSSESEGASVRVDAFPAGSDAPLTRTLYQFIDGRPPTGDLFAGGHGFTGLSYVYPPGASSEAQFWCRASEDDEREPVAGDLRPVQPFAAAGAPETPEFRARGEQDGTS